jgi:hypothetical protein
MKRLTKIFRNIKGLQINLYRKHHVNTLFPKLLLIQSKLKKTKNQKPKPHTPKQIKFAEANYYTSRNMILQHH